MTGSSLAAPSKQVQINAGGQQNVTISVEGDSASPTSLTLSGSDANGPLNEVLLPMMSRDIGRIVDAYRRCYAVITIGEVDGVTTCTEAWQGGPTLKARGGTIGLSRNVGFDYKEPRNITFPDDTVRKICENGSSGDTVTLNVPKLATEAGTPGPVMIQFVGDMDHFSDPPFRQPHDQLCSVFYEGYKRNCLSVEYSNSGEPLTLHFNHGLRRSHKSVIIVPTAF
ncbi:hypothetical protein [Erythrobacter sp. MTPC3]|uniref:hypothetical protein n=1 Tax=Erythrobacter sp. MTPC3 TaxID=3056564 RepID=UPI0036F2C40A